MSTGVLNIPLNEGNDRTKVGGILESLLSSLPVFSFNLGERIENYAIKKAQKSIDKNLPTLTGLISELDDVSMSEAKEGVELFEFIVPMISTIRESLLSNEEIDVEFKSSSLLFFNKFIELYERLEDIANSDYEYKVSLSAISEDWDSKSDIHWDSY